MMNKPTEDLRWLRSLQAPLRPTPGHLLVLNRALCGDEHPIWWRLLEVAAHVAAQQILQLGGTPSDISLDILAERATSKFVMKLKLIFTLLLLKHKVPLA